MAAPIGSVVQAGAAPWITVTPGPEKVDVHGLDHKLGLEPTPNIADALKTQLGVQLKSDYFSYLTVTCSQLSARINVDADKSPNVAGMDMSLQCLIFARGFTSTHNYSVSPSVAIDAAGGDAAFQQALPALLAASAKDIADKLRNDIKHTRN